MPFDTTIKIVEKDNLIIPPERRQYLRDIVDTVQNYKKDAEKQSEAARKLYQLKGAKEAMNDAEVKEIDELIDTYEKQIDRNNLEQLENFDELKEQYQQDQLTYKVRDKEFTVDLNTESISGLKIPKVSLPKYSDWGDRLYWLMTENVPGSFPYTAGVFPFKRKGEDPTRQFAGEGTPERTNHRFHYLSKNEEAKRLSTAFDSVTLYGEDPDERPDIYGKSR